LKFGLVAAVLIVFKREERQNKLNLICETIAARLDRTLAIVYERATLKIATLKSQEVDE
jgi:hypothetical protein